MSKSRNLSEQKSSFGMLGSFCIPLGVFLWVFLYSFGALGGQSHASLDDDDSDGGDLDDDCDQSDGEDDIITRRQAALLSEKKQNHKEEKTTQVSFVKIIHLSNLFIYQCYSFVKFKKESWF